MSSSLPGPHTDQLMALVYERLRDLAGAWFRKEKGDGPLQPTALVHEAYLRLAQQDLPQINSRTHFFAIAAREMRRMLVDDARAMGAQKRGGARQRVTLNEDAMQGMGRSVDVLALDEALNRLAGIHARQAQVVQMRFFGGLTVPEVAGELDVSVATIEKDWRIARAWLLRELEGA